MNWQIALGWVQPWKCRRSRRSGWLRTAGTHCSKTVLPLMWSLSRLWKDKTKKFIKEAAGSRYLNVSRYWKVGTKADRDLCRWICPQMCFWKIVLRHGFECCVKLYLAVVSVALKKWTSFNKSSIFCMSSCAQLKSSLNPCYSKKCILSRWVNNQQLKQIHPPSTCWPAQGCCWNRNPLQLGSTLKNAS